MTELAHTPIGRNQRFGPGDKVGSLEILEYIGKMYLPSEGSYDPMYLCRCKCGATIQKSQKYLENKRNRMQCNKCSHKSAAAKNKAIWKERREKKAEKSITHNEAMRLWSVPK